MCAFASSRTKNPHTGCGFFLTGENNSRSVHGSRLHGKVERHFDGAVYAYRLCVAVVCPVGLPVNTRQSVVAELDKFPRRIDLFRISLGVYGASPYSVHGNGRIRRAAAAVIAVSKSASFRL